MTVQHSRLEIQFLGTAEAFGEHPNTSILINDEFLLDCGFTTLNQLKKVNIPLKEIKWIFLSHLHGDHTFGLPAFLVASLEEKRENPLGICSIADAKEMVHNLLHLAYRKTPEDLGFPINFYLAEDKINLNDYSLSFAPLKHSISSRAISIKYNDWKVTYLADGVPTKEAEALVKNSDLLIAEAYQEGMDTHSSPLKAARIAKEQNVKKLALVHIYRGGAPSLEKARGIFPELFIPNDLESLILKAI